MRPEGPIVLRGAAPENVLAISVDTLRRDHVGRYGGGDLTPRLDELLATGVALDDHRSCSNWTYSSMLCLQHGGDELDAGFAVSTYNGQSTPLPDDVRLVSQTLADAGFETALFTTNSYFSSSVGTDRGFATSAWRSGIAAEATTAGALELADGLGRGPWYLHVHYIDPHASYDPPEAWLEGIEELPAIPFDLSEAYLDLTTRWHTLTEQEKAGVMEHLRFRYAAEVRYLDEQVGVLLDGMEERGLLEDALVLLVSDHGEQLWEHQGHRHGRSLYEEEIGAVAGLWARSLEPLSWEGPTSHEDLWPSAFGILGVEDEGFAGEPLGAHEEDRAVFALRYQGAATRQAVVSRGRKLIYTWEGRTELYLLDEDPGETRDRVDEEPGIVAELQDLLLPEVERLDALYEGDARPSVLGGT